MESRNQRRLEKWLCGCSGYKRQRDKTRENEIEMEKKYGGEDKGRKREKEERQKEERRHKTEEIKKNE